MLTSLRRGVPKLLIASTIAIPISCAPPTSTIAPAPTSDASTRSVGVALGLTPDRSVHVALDHHEARFNNGLLFPAVQVDVTNASNRLLRSPQVAIVMRHSATGWILEDCGVPRSIEPDVKPCDFESFAPVELGPGVIVSDWSSVPYVLDWPYGVTPAPGSFAIVVAFGVDRFTMGAAAELEVLAS